MKKLWLCALLCSSSAYAMDYESCETWAAKAHLYASWRLQDVPLAEAMQQTLGNMSRGLLIQAYQLERPSRFDEEYAVIDAFVSRITAECEAAQNQ